MTDNRIYRTRTLGIPAEGLRDQYADGKAARMWELYIGDKTQRTDTYRHFISDLLRKHNCHKILDVACGTGVDSIMLLEEGFEVTSVDLSDKMLKYALKTRWRRRKEPAFDKWTIEEANWLTLPEDIDGVQEFDAVVCLGNSFSHLPDSSEEQSVHREALDNFATMVKPGGMLLIDHRNYDYIIKHGNAPARNIYYNSNHIDDIKTSVLYVCGKPSLVTLDYEMTSDELKRVEHSKGDTNQFRLSYYPHLVAKFSKLLKESFGHGSNHEVYGDFQHIGEITDPGFYIHVVLKA